MVNGVQFTVKRLLADSLTGDKSSAFSNTDSCQDLTSNLLQTMGGRTTTLTRRKSCPAALHLGRQGFLLLVMGPAMREHNT